MSAHAGHLWVPIGEESRIAGLLAEYEKSKKVFRLSWRSRRQPPGRCIKLENLPVKTEKGMKTWNPLQVACMAYQAGYTTYDVFHVHTPVLGPGDRGIENLYFKTEMLRKLDTTDPDFFPNVEKGVIKFEDEAVNNMPGRFEITENGLFVPTVR